LNTLKDRHNTNPIHIRDTTTTNLQILSVKRIETNTEQTIVSIGIVGDDHGLGIEGQGEIWAGGSKGSVFRFDMMTRKLLGLIQIENYRIYGIVWIGEFVWVATEFHILFVIHAKTQIIVEQPTEHPPNSAIRSLIMHENRVWSGSLGDGPNGMLCIWDPLTIKKIKQITVEGPVQAMANSSHFIAVGIPQSVICFHPESYTVIYKLTDPLVREISSMLCVDDYFILAFSRGSVRQWRIPKQGEDGISACQVSAKMEELHSGRILCAATVGQLVLSGGFDGRIGFWTAKDCLTLQGISECFVEGDSIRCMINTQNGLWCGSKSLLVMSMGSHLPYCS